MDEYVPKQEVTDYCHLTSLATGGMSISLSKCMFIFTQDFIFKFVLYLSIFIGLVPLYLISIVMLYNSLSISKCYLDTFEQVGYSIISTLMAVNYHCFTYVL